MNKKLIQTESSVQYLGMIPDMKLTIWEQIKRTSEKAETVTVAVIRFMAQLVTQSHVRVMYMYDDSTKTDPAIQGTNLG